MDSEPRRHMLGDLLRGLEPPHVAYLHVPRRGRQHDDDGIGPAQDHMERDRGPEGPARRVRLALEVLAGAPTLHAPFPVAIARLGNAGVSVATSAEALPRDPYAKRRPRFLLRRTTPPPADPLLG